MKNKIGIIGGVGPQATNYLYNKIIMLAQTKYRAVNNDDFPEIIIYSIPVPDFITNKIKISKAIRMFKQVIQSFDKIGVKYIAIASNTVHILIDKFRRFSSIKFISIIDAVAQKIKLDNKKAVGLLASPTLIHSQIYSQALNRNKIKIITPNDKEQIVIEKIIRDVIAASNIHQHTKLKSEYVKIMQNLFNRGAESIILGCTELPLAINYEAVENKIYNSTDILAKKIVDVYYQ